MKSISIKQNIKILSKAFVMNCHSLYPRVMITAGNKGGIDLSAVKCRPMRCPFPEDTHRGMVEFSGLSIGSMAR